MSRKETWSSLSLKKDLLAKCVCSRAWGIGPCQGQGRWFGEHCYRRASSLADFVVRVFPKQAMPVILTEAAPPAVGTKVLPCVSAGRIGRAPSALGNRFWKSLLSSPSMDLHDCLFFLLHLTGQFTSLSLISFPVVQWDQIT